ncbi:aldo-keto reductase-like protein [Microdochium trichocladiopsis]|uniref:Aldo-keto reductase-like protein n=1 Tax=Microdochium trichocladiopsis TaxID=1682393 RepID=A0A9P8YJU3_9PEZI|nr:aldo-keto reductase-like protein [Microdochium trichocladiopsis]KAH7041600.1 aldo-keto reductase-like protein [Microdochium trichocladiopsis]
MASITAQSAFKLNSGYELPLVGFGVYQIPAAEAEKATAEALKVGYRHIDSAAAYKNEAACGEAIRKSGVPRGDIFYTTKIPPGKNMGYEAAKAQIDTSLKEAGFDYLDLVLFHAPYGGSAVRKQVWKALVEAVEEGKVRSIGVSNYGVHHLDELEQHIKELEAERGGPGKGGVLSVVQHEAHPWCVRKDIAEWSAKRNVAVEAYCPLVRGQRAEDKTLAKLSEKYGKTWAQVLTRWSLQKGFVPLPKSVTPSRIKDNFAVFDFELTPEEVAELETDEYSPIAWDPVKSGLDD